MATSVFDYEQPGRNLPPGCYTLPKQVSGHWYLFPFADLNAHPVFLLKLHDDGFAEYCRVSTRSIDEKPSMAVQIHSSVWCPKTWWRYNSDTTSIWVCWVECGLRGTFRLSPLPLDNDGSYRCDIWPAGTCTGSKWVLRRLPYFNKGFFTSDTHFGHVNENAR